MVTCVWLKVDDRREVGHKSVEAGVALCRWFANEALRIYATLSESNEDREARKLVEFIQARGGQIAPRGLMRANCRKYPTTEMAEEALEGLVQAGCGEWREQAKGKRGGRPTKTFVLRMTHDTTDKTPDGDEDDGEGDEGGETDTTADETGQAPTNPEETGGSVGCVMRHAGGNETPTPEGRTESVGTSSSAPEEVVSDGCVTRSPFVLRARGEASPCYQLVRDAAGLEMVNVAVDGSGLVGLDLETTGLDARWDRIRLLTVATETVDGGTFTYVVDCFAVDPSPLLKVLTDKDLVLHNASFDLGFLARLGFTPAGKVHDTMLLAQLLAAGTDQRVKLPDCCQRFLDMQVDKTEQKSDWSGDLTSSQLAYAARDAEVLVPLLQVLLVQIEKAGLAEVGEVERRCQPAVAWMARNGAPLDAAAWRELATSADQEAERVLVELNQTAPAKPGEMFDAWNWDSTQQVRQVLALAGCPVDDTTDETLAATDHPLAQLLRRYRLARKRTSTYGADWLQHVRDDGRVYPTWRQIGAASGRMSCSDPNMQQLPRGEHRRCVAAPPGRVLVKADYSQIELRIAAKVSGDPELLEAYQRGEDLHTLTARSVLGIGEVTRRHRQLAKALNFGLLYGMGAKGFRIYARTQYGLELTDSEADRYRRAFFQSYPGLAAWHRQVGRSREKAETRTLAGRRRLDVERFTEKLNTPIQGTGADGLKAALALLWERRNQALGAFPVLAVHDEVVVECDQSQAEEVTAWLKRAMLDGMVPLVVPVPVEVEVRVARTWGGE